MKNTKLNKLEKKSLQCCLITINIMLAGTKIDYFIGFLDYNLV